MSYGKQAISWISFAMLAACSSESGKLGSYIASENNAAFMVQITSIEDGKINGSMSVITSDENGKTAAVTRPMSGMIEGTSLNLSMENGTGLSLVTGTIEGNNLRLTFFSGGNSSQLKFIKSDAGKFEELANATRHRAAEKQQETEAAAAIKDRMEQRKKAQTSIDRLADNMLAKSGEIRSEFAKFDTIIAKYRATYDRAEKMKNAKRRVNTETPESAYRISQIDYEIEGMFNGIERMHYQAQYYTQSLREFMADASSRSSQFFVECQADELLDCSRLSAGLQSLRTQFQQFEAGYARENAAFKSKRA